MVKAEIGRGKDIQLGKVERVVEKLDGTKSIKRSNTKADFEFGRKVVLVKSKEN